MTTLPLTEAGELVHAREGVRWTRAMILAAAAELRREAEADGTARWLYFIQAGGERGPIKVGTTRDVDKRLRSLQVGCPQTLVLLAKTRVHPLEERILHKRWDRFRLRGEWFRPGHPILQRIRDCQGAA